MTTAAQAIANAQKVTSWAVGRCDEFVARMYGFGSSGYATAVANWQQTPGSLKHAGDWNAPAGSLMYWSGGSTGAGHVALSLGNGNIISTDAHALGSVGTIPARTPTDKWGHPYLGWTYPYFQGKEATGTLGGFTPGTSGSTSVATAGTQVSADAITTGFVSGILAPFKFLLSTFLWGAEIGTGALLVLVGIWLFARRANS
jgi:hypothetical protein